MPYGHALYKIGQANGNKCLGGLACTNETHSCDEVRLRNRNAPWFDEN
jgi:hypothetical protein